MPPKKAPGLTQQKKKKKSILWDRDGVNVMVNRGIHHRDAKGIRQKIADLQSSYNKARDFIKNTGEGILAEDEANGIHNVQARILELCPYWDLLDPVMSDRSVTEPLHIRSSVGGDQPGRPGSPEDGLTNTPEPKLPSVSTSTTRLNQPLGPSEESESSELPDINFDWPQPPIPTPQVIPAQATSTSAALQKKKAKRTRSLQRSSTRSSSRIKKKTTEDLYMKSIVSKRQAEVTRARADASKVKVAYMKELREHGLTLEEIELKAAAEFPPLADMDNDKSDESDIDSD
ncbi:hypothetical protein PSHT_01025 [Puccinia striiformis]|uniref:Uncharacterized protein n=1 Tax=Puccinia striiformis TaxID=27350 RepID=A0A2S4WLH3_9BASI|nr:hypothetical protein PSHT_01025 [Puccinia striiformis]